MISYEHLNELKRLYILKYMGFSYCNLMPLNSFALDKEIHLPKDMSALHKIISNCHLCNLSKSRTAVQVGEGKVESKVMIISDFPTLAEDNSGAYAGKAGRSLRAMVEKVLKLDINEVYFTHVVKCMPASSKLPNESECKSCQPFWQQQIKNINPKLIVALGSFSYNILTNGSGDFKKDKGSIISYLNRKLIAIEHPKVLMRNPRLKAITMQELILIKSYLCDL